MQEQPFIVCRGDLLDQQDYFIVVEKTVISCGEKIEHAFNVLFCSFHALLVKYPKHLNSFFKFFDQVVYKTPTCTFSPQTATFMSQLMFYNNASD